MASRWLRRLLGAVGGCWEWQGLALHLGFRYRPPEDESDCREVWAYPAVQEILGGRHDAKTGWCGFHLDVSGLLGQFEAGHADLSTGTGRQPPELVVEGRFRGREVVLHVCLGPPEGVGATEVIDLTGPAGATVREKG
jgi:hypothetical protein